MKDIPALEVYFTAQGSWHRDFGFVGAAGSSLANARRIEVTIHETFFLERCIYRFSRIILACPALLDDITADNSIHNGEFAMGKPVLDLVIIKRLIVLLLRHDLVYG